jgi:hypothetical protein
MSNKKSLCDIKTTADNNNKRSQLLQKDFRNIERNNNFLVLNYNNNIENNYIKELKRKIDTITRYQKPYISKILNILLVENPINVKIICNYIIPEQNEINIKESTKETKIKRIIHLSKLYLYL